MTTDLALHRSCPAVKIFVLYQPAGAVLVTNIIPEYLVSMILVPHVVLGVRRGLKLGVEPHAHSAADQNNA